MTARNTDSGHLSELGAELICPYCKGALYTGHKADCPLDRADRERIKEIAREAVDEYVKASQRRLRRAF